MVLPTALSTAVLFLWGLSMARYAVLRYVHLGNGFGVYVFEGVFCRYEEALERYREVVEGSKDTVLLVQIVRESYVEKACGVICRGREDREGCVEECLRRFEESVCR